MSRKRLPWVVAVLALAAVGWFLASREEPASTADVARPARTSSGPRDHTPAVVEAAAPAETAPDESAVAGQNRPKILQILTPDRRVPSPRREDDTPNEPRFWEAGQDVDAPDALAPGVAADGPEAEAVFEAGEWQDAEWFGDERPLPGEGEP